MFRFCSWTVKHLQGYSSNFWSFHSTNAGRISERDCQCGLFERKNLQNASSTRLGSIFLEVVELCCKTHNWMQPSVWRSAVREHLLHLASHACWRGGILLLILSILMSQKTGEVSLFFIKQLIFSLHRTVVGPMFYIIAPGLWWVLLKIIPS